MMRQTPAHPTRPAFPAARPRALARRRSGVLALVALTALTAVAGCANNRLGEGNAAAPVYVERPVDVLYNEARDLLGRGNYVEAIAGFVEVDRQHPFSEWARRAQLMIAYANYQTNKYEDAIAASRRFIESHPQDVNAPYAYYLIAICYFEQIVDVGRDQRMTELALAALNEVTQSFPQSDYARDARLKMEMARDQLAGKEMEIGRYYLTQDQHLAAIGRFRRVVDLYQTTTHVPEALHRLVEAYVSLGVIDEATKVGAVLGYNYPGSEWYERSYELLTSRDAQPDAAPRRGLMRWFSPRPATPERGAERAGPPPGN
jgi:outer membrane protein assembly factor BamD